MLMTRAYRQGRPVWWQAIPTQHLALIACHIVIGVWTRRPLPVLGLMALSYAVHRSARLGVMCLIFGVVGVHLSNLAWLDTAPDHLGPYVGWACLKTDPAPKGGAMVVVLEIQGERFESWARGSPRRRLTEHLAGECAVVTGNRRALAGVTGRRAAIRHVVGGFDLKVVGDWSAGSAMDRASNRVRRLFAAGSGTLRSPDDALFAGLVIGDDRNEPTAMITQFRRSGLAHLTAVSGQNVV